MLTLELHFVDALSMRLDSWVLECLILMLQDIFNNELNLFDMIDDPILAFHEFIVQIM